MSDGDAHHRTSLRTAIPASPLKTAPTLGCGDEEGLAFEIDFMTAAVRAAQDSEHACPRWAGRVQVRRILTGLVRPPLIEKALEEDPQRYGAEYLSQWRDNLASYIGRDLLDAAVDRGVIVRPPASSVHYIAGCDASGGRNDSFTAAIAHKERNGRVVLDLAYERKPPFNPADVVEEIAGLMRQYKCHQITGDNYAAGWVEGSFGKAGIRYIKSDRDRSAVYMDTVPLFTSGRARLLDGLSPAEARSAFSPPRPCFEHSDCLRHRLRPSLLLLVETGGGTLCARMHSLWPRQLFLPFPRQLSRKLLL